MYTDISCIDNGTATQPADFGSVELVPGARLAARLRPVWAMEGSVGCNPDTHRSHVRIQPGGSMGRRAGRIPKRKGAGAAAFFGMHCTSFWWASFRDGCG